MAAVLVVLLSWGSVASGVAQEATGRPFITKWQGKAGEELRIPIVGKDYKLVIKNKMGEVVDREEKLTVERAGYYTFTPTANSVYTVEAGPEGVHYMEMSALRTDYGGYILYTSNNKLLEVVQFGTVAWRAMDWMFYMCYNMTFAANIDTPDLTKVTNMFGMFDGCSAFNQPLEHWDVSQVTDMRWMFYDCTAFNQPLEKWDVSKVTSMYEMFYRCRAFNQPLNHWNVSKVTNMHGMFYDCSAFNQPLGAWTLQTAIGISGTAMSAVNYSLSLIGWAKQTDGASNIRWDISGLVYNDAGKEAREKLIARGWSFYGDTYRPSETVAFSLAKEGEGTLAIEGYNDEELQAIKECTELTVIAVPKDGYTLTSLTAGTQDILATKKFTVTGSVTVKAVFKKMVAISLVKEGEGTLAVEGYNDAALQAVAEGTELTVTATPNDGYTLTSLTAGTQDILATKKFTVTGAVTVKAVFKKKENNGGGNGGGSWQPQKPGTAVEDAVLASLSVAPNPFTAQLRIDNPEGVTGRYELVNAAGVVVRTGAFVATEVFVDTEALSAGLYLVRLMGQNGANRVERVSKH